MPHALRLPAEVTDNILDYLHDDRPTLRTCCLVSRSWLPSCRYHLFSEVVVRSAEHPLSLANFLEFVPTSPDIASYIRTLRVVTPKKTPLREVYVEDLEAALEPLCRLERLIVDRVALCSRSSGAELAAPPTGPRRRLTEFACVDCHMTDSTLFPLYRLLGLFTDIQMLSILELTAPEDAPHAVTPIPPTFLPLDLRVECFNLSSKHAGTIMEQALNLLQRCFAHDSNIRSVTMTPYCPRDVTLADQFLRDRGAPIEMFTCNICLGLCKPNYFVLPGAHRMSFPYDCSSRVLTPWIVTDLWENPVIYDLGPCTGLKQLDLQFVVSSFLVVMNVATATYALFLTRNRLILETAPPTLRQFSMQFVTFGPAIQGNLDVLGQLREQWALFDDALARCPALESVQLIVRDETPGLGELYRDVSEELEGEDEFAVKDMKVMLPEYAKLFRQVLPQAYRRGILEVYNAPADMLPAERTKRLRRVPIPA